MNQAEHEVKRSIERETVELPKSKLEGKGQRETIAKLIADNKMGLCIYPFSVGKSYLKLSLSN